MLTLADYHCPICSRSAARREGSYILCSCHGWVKPIVAIEIKS
jgi:hypothetical protein